MPSPIHPTPFQLHLLTLIHTHPGITASTLATLLWPDSPAHQKSYTQGPRASCHGKGAWLSAGSHVAKLRLYGWVEVARKPYTDRRGRARMLYSGYRITQKGQSVLAAHQLLLFNH